MSELGTAEVVRAAFKVAVEEGPRGLRDRFSEWFADDFEWSPILLTSVDGRVYRGREGWEEYWGEFLQVFADVKFEPGSFEPVGEDRVLIVGVVRASGAGGGVPIDREVAYVFQTRDGKIAKGNSFFTEEDARKFLERA